MTRRIALLAISALLLVCAGLAAMGWLLPQDEVHGLLSFGLASWALSQF